MNRNDGQKPETDSIGRFFMEQYFADLIPELNLRLLCEKQVDTDAFLPPERLFWIEDITILTYDPGIYRQQTDRNVPRTEVPLCLPKRILEWIKTVLRKQQGKAQSLSP